MDYIVPENLERFSGVKAVFTTRLMPEPMSILEKGIKRIITAEQRHSDRVVVIESRESRVESRESRESRVESRKSRVKGQIKADALITREKGLLIGIHVADCVPILIYDPSTPAVAAVHAGWRGTAKEILKKTLREMNQSFDTSMTDIFISIGPSIRGCCYEVGEEVAKVLQLAGQECPPYRDRRGFLTPHNNEKFLIDLTEINRMQAIEMGVKESNIWVSSECTFHNPERFFSYRYQQKNNGKDVGRQGGFIGLVRSEHRDYYRKFI